MGRSDRRRIDMPQLLCKQYKNHVNCCCRFGYSSRFDKMPITMQPAQRSKAGVQRVSARRGVVVTCIFVMDIFLKSPNGSPLLAVLLPFHALPPSKASAYADDT